MITRLTDLFLVVTNILHLFVLVCFLHPVESPLKKALLTAVRSATRYQNPVLSSIVLILFAAITAASTYQYCCPLGHPYEDNNSAAYLIRALVGTYSFLVALCIMKFTSTMQKLGVKKVMEFEQEMSKYDIIHFQPPPLSVMSTLFAPAEALLPPDVNGLENVPSDGAAAAAGGAAAQPSLFVMNHSLLGVEMPLLLQTLYREKGIFVRGLADHLHFCAPSGPVLKRFGAVNGTRENCDVLMRARQNVLVYPGGAKEVMKNKSVPKYDLMWKERLGFARLAIKHSYQIVPCCAVGMEDMMDIVWDLPVPYRGMTVPVVTTAPHRLQKVYFWFGKPIPTAQYKGEYTNTHFCIEVRNKAKMAVEEGIRLMRKKQDSDPQRFLTQQVRSALRSKFSRAASFADDMSFDGFESDDDKMD